MSHGASVNIMRHWLPSLSFPTTPLPQILPCALSIFHPHLPLQHHPPNLFLFPVSTHIPPCYDPPNPTTLPYLFVSPSCHHMPSCHLQSHTTAELFESTFPKTFPPTSHQFPILPTFSYCLPHPTAQLFKSRLSTYISNFTFLFDFQPHISTSFTN